MIDLTLARLNFPLIYLQRDIYIRIQTKLHYFFFCNDTDNYSVLIAQGKQGRQRVAT